VKTCFTHADNPTSPYFHTWQLRHANPTGVNNRFIPVVSDLNTLDLVKKSTKASHSGYIAIASVPSSPFLFREVQNHWKLARVIAPIVPSEATISEYVMWYKQCVHYGTRTPQNIIGLVNHGDTFDEHLSRLTVAIEAVKELVATKIIVFEWSTSIRDMKQVYNLYNLSPYVAHHFIMLGASPYVEYSPNAEYVEKVLDLTKVVF